MSYPQLVRLLGFGCVLVGVACLGACHSKTDPDTAGDTSQGLAAGECRADADCGDTGGFCFTADSEWCGTCNDPEILCTGAGDCDEGQVCAPETLTCPCSPSEDTSWSCVAACSEESCADGERCDTASGLCEVIHCADGATCPAHHSCDADTAETGCVRDSCTDDAGCGGGWCVLERCFEELGYCSQGPA